MTEVGNLIYALQATDADSGPAGQLHYIIASGNEVKNFKLHQQSNNIVEIQSNSAGLLPGTYDLTIIVMDGQPPLVKNDTAVVTVTVILPGNISCNDNDDFG